MSDGEAGPIHLVYWWDGVPIARRKADPNEVLPEPGALVMLSQDAHPGMQNSETGAWSVESIDPPTVVASGAREVWIHVTNPANRAADVPASVGRELTQAEAAINAETWQHIHDVRVLLTRVVGIFMRRMLTHDQTKLRDPEVEAFARMTPKLKGSTYGSEEYRRNLAELGPALQHHYRHNRHHPEHYDAGIEGMTLLDVVEMLADWKAATMRHDDGDIMRSIDVNADRFGLSPQLCQLMRNTVLALGWDQHTRDDHEVTQRGDLPSV
jgi:hypothetical protein